MVTNNARALKNAERTNADQSPGCKWTRICRISTFGLGVLLCRDAQKKKSGPIVSQNITPGEFPKTDAMKQGLRESDPSPRVLRPGFGPDYSIREVSPEV